MIKWYYPSKSSGTVCLADGYVCTGSNMNYKFTADNNGAYATIYSLDRLRDSGTWTCEGSENLGTNSIVIIVHTSPKGVKYMQPIVSEADLGQESIDLICQTGNCTYPPPSILWFYLNNQQQNVRYDVSDGVMVNNTTPCDQFEAIYTSALHLTRGTTFQGKIPFKTKFVCGVHHPAFDGGLKYSEPSNYINFAVNLISVTLKDMNDNALPSTMELVQGSVVILKCVTSISRPTATVRWYIGSTNVVFGIQNVAKPGDHGLEFMESNLTFTPNNNEHHNKYIYCQAYSSVNSSFLQSTQHMLFVKVPVAITILKNATLPKRGEGLKISCQTSPYIFTNGQMIKWSYPSRSSVTTCIADGYVCTGSNMNYNFTADNNGAYAIIYSLDRIRDSGTWTCTGSDNLGTNNTVIDIYTSPKVVKYVQPSGFEADLGQKSIDLICQTENCTYPPPIILWFYLDNQQQKVQYDVSDGVMVTNTAPCDQLEAIYTSTLHLTRGTTFEGNIPFKTKFVCGVQHPALDGGIQYSEPSNYINFAVNLTSVTLKDSNDNALPSTLKLVQVSVVILKCVTSTSRPTATVRWYIGSTHVISGIENVAKPGDYGLEFMESNLTFTPNNNDHHTKYIYCHAYSSVNSSFLQSNQHMLFVKVEGTPETLGILVAVIAGGVSAGFVLILVMVLGIFLWRRSQRKKQNEDENDEVRKKTERSVRHDAASGQEYEGLHLNRGEASPYLQHNDILFEENRNANTRSPEIDSYETLHHYTNNDIQMYSSLKIPRISKDSERMYENNKDTITDLTAEYQ